MKVLITNTLNQPLNLFYRLPAIVENGASRLIEVNLPPRALAHEVVFSEKEHFEAFEKQNRRMIDAQTIVIGKASEKTAEKISNDNAAKFKGEIKKRKDKVISTFEQTADGTNANMKFNVEGAK